MEDKIIYSHFRFNDLDCISNILESDFDDFYSYDILKKELINAHNFYWCLKRDSEILGFAGISVVLDTAELNNIVIKKSERGNGYSELLLNKMILVAKNRGCKRMQLEVKDGNVAAIHLYNKFGFKQVGKRAGYYNGEDALLFTLDFC